MRFSAVLVASTLCLTSPLIGQASQTPRQALTRVSAPLRQAPDIDARSLITIPPKTTVDVSSCADGCCAVNLVDLAQEPAHTTAASVDGSSLGPRRVQARRAGASLVGVSLTE